MSLCEGADFAVEGLTQRILDLSSSPFATSQSRTGGALPFRHEPGGTPTYFLKARLNAASDS